MTHYIALIHKERESEYGVSFPDLPGVIASAPSLDAALSSAAEALVFAAEDWSKLTGEDWPKPSSLDLLRENDIFRRDSQDAVVAAIPLISAFSNAAE